MKKKIVMLICKQIWDFSEYFNIKLGKLAPYIFGGMIDADYMKRIK